MSSLDAQLTKDAKADPETLRKVLHRLSGTDPGLKLPRFVRVREALETWLAELSTQDRADLPKAVLAAKETSRRSTAAQVQEAKANLLAAAARLDTYLTNGRYGSDWRKYLHWDQLQAQLKAEKPSAETLELVESRIGADQKGLELKPFADVRGARSSSTRIPWRLPNAKDLQAEYAAKLDSLAKGLEEFVKKPSPALAAAVGKDLGWLQRSDRRIPWCAQSGGTIRLLTSMPSLLPISSAPASNAMWIRFRRCRTTFWARALPELGTPWAISTRGSYPTHTMHFWKRS